MNTEFKIHLLRNLKYLRQREGYSQKQMAELFGYSDKSCYSNIERGVRKASIQVLVKASEVFGVSVDDLLKRELQEMKEHNKSLADAAHDAGVKTTQEYAIFQNKGYQGLYGGLSRGDIHRRKGLKKNQNILDHMGHEELAANLFRATQTEAKLRRENIQGKEQANQTHYEVGKKVRQTISDLGGTMPEDLSTPEKSIKQSEGGD